jgi:hypothetical protein
MPHTLLKELIDKNPNLGEGELRELFRKELRMLFLSTEMRTRMLKIMRKRPAVTELRKSKDRDEVEREWLEELFEELFEHYWAERPKPAQ